jgi:hypothetical protein
MKINRSELLSSLVNFVAEQSGVIIGVPGVGKSHIISQLIINLVEKNIPACMIKLDNLTNGSDEDIASSLGMPDANWIANLKLIPAPQQGRATIVFDAFDTLRDEKLKEILLQKIAQVKKELPDWSMIVSVRTYDAHQSQKLIELFPGGLSQDGLDCRKFTIPELSDNELQQFLNENEKLKSLYQVANGRLRDIFKIPFYLKLLDFILTHENTDINSLSIIKSEIELLDRYWNKVVAVIKPVLSTEVILRKLTSEMIGIKQLSINKYDFLDKFSQDEILIVDRLLSENVLKEQGATQNQLSYSHNILFDYAVSKLIIKESSKELVQFIEDDATRPLFLRPSFIYFFTRLWYQERQKFWEIYEELSKQNDENIRLFNKLIPSAVVVREFENAADIVWAQSHTKDHRAQIQDILQGFRYLKTRASIEEKAVFLKCLSADLQVEFIGDFSLLLNNLLEDHALKINEKAFTACGVACRNFYDYCLLHRNDEGLNLEDLIAYRAVPGVAKTFASDQAESKKRLEETLITISTPGFNLRSIANLVDELDRIVTHDQEFVTHIYKVIFNHEETEDVPTTMHSSVLLTLTSNRRDELQSCHFRLKGFFPTFLRAYPEQAVPLALEICNTWVNKRNSDGIIIKPEYTIPTEMIINGVPARYKVDMSHFWGDMPNYHDELTILEQVFRYFDELINQAEIGKLKDLIGIYISEAHTAYEWASLLEWAGKHVDLIHNELFDLLLQPAILYWSDTIKPAGNFLEQAVVWLQPDQLKQIEDAVISLSSYVPESDAEKVQAVIFRLLSRIPKKKLQRDDAKALFNDKEPAANDPLVTFTSSSETYTTRMFLEDQGVNIHDPLTDDLLSAEQHLSQFNNAYNGRLPDADTYKNALEIAIDVYDKIKANSHLPQDVVSSTLQSVASLCALVLKSDAQAKYIGKTVTTDYTKIKQIILDCMSLHTSSDTYAEKHYSPGNVYSSTPKSSAASGLTYLYTLTADEALLPLIQQFCIDKNSVTRFYVQQSIGALYDSQPDLFWQIVMERLENEQDYFAWRQIILRLDRKSIFENEQTKLIQAFEIAQVHTKDVKQGSEFFNNFLLLASNFVRRTDNAGVKELLLKCVRENALVAHNLIYTVLELIQPENVYRNLQDENDNAESKRLVVLLLAILDDCEKTFLNAKDSTEHKLEVEQTFKTLDQTVMRVYFSLQINERLNQPGKGKIIISKEDQERFYWMVKPLLERTLQIAEEIQFMQAHTAHYFIEILGVALDFDAEYALSRMRKITELTIVSGYLQDRSGIQEAVKFTQKLLGNHKLLLTNDTAFSHIKSILELYATAGWPEALELLWQLDEIFR